MVKWKNVKGYEEDYEVSNDGKVRSKEGKTTFTERHGKRIWKVRVLKQKTCKQNSKRVDLWKDGKGKTHLVHRLVAFAFIPEVTGKNLINHKDGNRGNNTVENLEWCTYKENSNHAFDTGLMTTNIKTRLINKETKEIHEFRSMKKASEFLGRNHGYLSARTKRGNYKLDDYVLEVLK